MEATVTLFLNGVRGAILSIIGKSKDSNLLGERHALVDNAEARRSGGPRFESRLFLFYSFSIAEKSSRSSFAGSRKKPKPENTSSAEI